VELGYLSANEAVEIWEAWERMEKTPGAWMITPGVLEIIGSL
jgi:hypothetical protein